MTPKLTDVPADFTVTSYPGGPLLDLPVFHDYALFGGNFSATHNGTNYTHFGKVYIEVSGGIFVAMVLVPIVLYYLLRWCTRIARRPNKWSLVKKVKAYIKRRLVERDLMGQLEPRWKDVNDIVFYLLHWRYHDVRDYTWWFWDPDQEQAKVHASRKNESFLRYLPEWMRRGRPVAQEGSYPRKDDSPDLEQGVERPSRYLHPTRDPNNVSQNSKYQGNFHFKPSHNTDNRSECRTTSYFLKEDLMKVPGTADVETVRRRIVSHGLEPVWSSGSEETDRAVRKQLLESSHGDQQAPPMLIHLFIPPSTGEVSKARSDSMPLHGIQRSQSMPAMPSRTNVQDKKQKLDTRTSQSVEQPVLPQDLVAHGPDTIGRPQASRNGSLLISSKSLPELRKRPEHKLPTATADETIEYPLDEVFDPSQSATSNTIARNTLLQSKRSVLIKQREKGICAQYIPRLPSLSPEVLSAYEADSSLDEARCDSESSTSTRTRMVRLSRYRKRWSSDSSVIDSINLRSNTILNKVHGRTRSGRLASAYVTPRVITSYNESVSNLLPQKRKRPVDRGIHVSLHEEHSSFKNETDHNVDSDDAIQPPATALSANCKSSPILRHTKLRKPIFPSKESNFDTPRTSSTPLPPKELHSRLNRLQYELSPGFRLPGSALGHIFGKPAPMFNPNIQTRAPNLRIRPPSICRRKSSAAMFRTATTPKLYTMTSAQARVPTGPNEELLRSKQRLDQELLGEEKYNTNWVLKQPPRVEDNWGGRETLYAGGFGIRRTLVEWRSGAANVGRERRGSEGDLAESTGKDRTRMQGARQPVGFLGRAKSENVRVKRD